jgi:hypothetical protein
VEVFGTCFKSFILWIANHEHSYDPIEDEGNTTVFCFGKIILLLVVEEAEEVSAYAGLLLHIINNVQPAAIREDGDVLGSQPNL